MAARKAAEKHVRKKHYPRKNTREKLLVAGQQEFCEVGFQGTDSNKIAKRAGFAPQTFYRWFASKSDIFLTVYQRWINREFSNLGVLLEQKASMQQLIDSGIQSHREFRVFRRSLRYLSLTDAVIRSARAESRSMQVSRIAKWSGSTSSPGQIAALLLQVERLNDAAAEDELADMGLGVESLRGELAKLYTRLGITAQ